MASPKPYLVAPSSQWAGIDGNWSTFTIQVGTPPQSFNILPSTNSSETWIPAPDLCVSISSAFPNCGHSRGVVAAEGAQRQGFLSNESSTWDPLGIYQLGAEQNLFASDNGLYGLDTILVGDGGSHPIVDQIVAGIASPNFWLGSLGLGRQASEFSVVSNNTPSLLSSMKALNLTPSLSFGYATGASYKSLPGSLILGGYDKNAFEPNDISFAVSNNTAGALSVNLKSLVVTNSLEGTMSVPLNGSTFDLAIDSTVSQSWLPEPVCDSLAAALGLVFDPTTGLYVLSTKAHQTLVDNSPEFTFTLAANSSSRDTMDIVLPFAAFDLELQPPTYNYTVPYFPIRRAANETQYVLGRAFLQEAYVVVDWERGSFTLSQMAQQEMPQRVVPILPLEEPRNTGSGGLGTAVIAGIAVAAVVAVIVVIVGTWLFRRRNRDVNKLVQDSDELSVHAHEKAEEPLVIGELHSDQKPGHELMSNELTELHEEPMKPQLMSTQVYELAGNSSAQELEVLEKKPDSSRSSNHVP